MSDKQEEVPPSIAERHKRAVPDGWQLVPKEPTEAMKDAYFEARESRFSALKPDEIYRAMLAAAPLPPAAVQEQAPLLADIVNCDRLWHAYSTAEKCPTFSRGDARYFSDVFTRIRSALSPSQSNPAPEIAAPSLVAQLERMANIAEDRLVEIERLRKALQPFADRASRYDEIPGVLLIGDNVELWQLEDNKGMRVDIAVVDLRRARAAVAPQQEEAK